jgi:uncharacterized membrane protein YeaQ/YmgE (transglycosylase-associated protein family)
LHAQVQFEAAPGRTSARRFPPPWSAEESAIVGAIAGWLAGMVVKGGGYGLIGDIVVGIVGALIAGWLLPQIGIVIGGGIVAAIINAFIGAVILLIILRLVRRAA